MGTNAAQGDPSMLAADSTRSSLEARPAVVQNSRPGVGPGVGRTHADTSSCGQATVGPEGWEGLGDSQPGPTQKGPGARLRGSRGSGEPWGAQKQTRAPCEVSLAGAVRAVTVSGVEPGTWPNERSHLILTVTEPCRHPQLAS